MSVTSGFYNSLNGDRKYNAEQMSSLFEGIIRDGIFEHVGNAFDIKAVSGNQITVDTGRAWFDKIWINNDALLPINMPDAEVLLPRWDAVVIEVNKSEQVRAADIKVLTGVAATNAKYPALTKNDFCTQYALAYINRPAGSTQITQSNILINISNDSTPYITGPLEVVSMERHVAQWGAQFKEWMDENNIEYEDWYTGKQTSFDEWFESLQTTLEGNVATQLASQILALESDIADLESDIAAMRSSIVNATLSAAYWTGTEAPFTYTLSLAGVTDTSVQELLLRTDATAEVVEVAQAANIQDGGQSTNTVIYKAWGDKPEIDIPVRIIKRGDL